jgi:hypothetical protein
MFSTINISIFLIFKIKWMNELIFVIDNDFRIVNK